LRHAVHSGSAKHAVSKVFPHTPVSVGCRHIVHVASAQRFTQKLAAHAVAQTEGTHAHVKSALLIGSRGVFTRVGESDAAGRTCADSDDDHRAEPTHVRSVSVDTAGFHVTGAIIAAMRALVPLLVSTAAACASSEHHEHAASIDATAAWDHMKQTLPGTWRARTPRGSTVDVSYRLVSNGSALVETYGVGSGRETVTVYYRDHGDLWLTHYCAQGNQPRLRATLAAADDVVLRLVDATNVSPDQGVMIERRTHLAPDAFDLTETYRDPSGPPDVTTLHFVRVDEADGGGGAR
jgi:hypothetical protein